MGVALIDANILIDALNGIPAAFEELKHWSHPAISCIAYIELYAGAKLGEEAKFGQLMVHVRVVHTDDDIARLAARFRADSIAKQPKRGVPDCIIDATAVSLGLVLVTRNPKDFKNAVIRVPYRLGMVTDILTPPDDEKYVMLHPLVTDAGFGGVG